MLKSIYNHTAIARFNKFSIISYGVYFSIGIVCFLSMHWLFSLFLGVNINDAYLWQSSLTYCLFFIIGTKLLRLFKSRKQLFNNSRLTLKKNGNSFYGGVFGFILASLFMSYQNDSISLIQYLDLVAISLPVFQIFIRLGCASYGCCYGKPVSSNSPHVIYSDKQSPAYKKFGSIPLFPTQSYSIYKNCILFMTLIALFFILPRQGVLIVAWCLLYSSFRFLMDFTRDNVNVELNYGLRKSQWISILTFFVGLALWNLLSMNPYDIDFEVDFSVLFNIHSVAALVTVFIISVFSFAVSFVITRDGSSISQ